MIRLSERSAPLGAAPPSYDRRAQRCGMVHLGLGAFHRAHQAVYTDDALAAGDRDWAITGVSLRAPAVRDALAPQDGLYTVTERGSGGETTRLIGAVRKVLVAPEAPHAVADALAAADAHIVTLTVTEKGYVRAPDGTLDLDRARPGCGTLYEHLASAFAARRAGGRPGLTLISCDNLADNGAVLASTLTAWLDRYAPGLTTWFAQECACPSSTIDRIVPAATAADLDGVAMALGVRDEGAVICEPYRAWVLEDRFVGPRPRWEAGGARFAANIRPYQTAKLRMLNGAHSALAYLGLRAGHSFVHEAVHDPAIRRVVERLMRVEAPGGIDPAPGQDLQGYADALLVRFANAALPHRLSQIAADGSQKIAARWLASLADNRARGRRCPATLAALAAWLAFVRGAGHPVEDPRAAELAGLWKAAGSQGIVDAAFASDVLGAAWRPDREERAQLSRLLHDALACPAAG